jgi:hypothetical protein
MEASATAARSGSGPGCSWACSDRVLMPAEIWFFRNLDTAGEFRVRSMFARALFGVWLDRGSSGSYSLLFASSGRRNGEFASSVSLRAVCSHFSAAALT